MIFVVVVVVLFFCVKCIKPLTILRWNNSRTYQTTRGCSTMASYFGEILLRLLRRCTQGFRILAQ